MKKRHSHRTHEFQSPPCPVAPLRLQRAVQVYYCQGQVKLDGSEHVSSACGPHRPSDTTASSRREKTGLWSAAVLMAVAARVS